MADVLVPREPVPVAPQGRRASAWYGMLFLIATEAALFIYLLFSYFFLASQAPDHWPPSGAPDPLIAAIDTFVLIASSGTAWWAQRGIQLGSSVRLVAGSVPDDSSGRHLRRRAGLGVGAQELHTRDQCLWLALFHDHRAAHRARRRWSCYPDFPGGLGRDGTLHGATASACRRRRALLALRRRRMDLRVLHLLPLAKAGLIA